MKNVYFVRHGESEENASEVRHSDGSHLTEKGKKQAEFLAKRFESLKVDLIISSTYIRAIQTAEIISFYIKKPIITSDLLIERILPSEQIGLQKNSEKDLELINAFEKNLSIAGARISNEENFDDLKTRAIKAIKFIEDREEQFILVITHGFILWVILSVLLLRDDLTGKELIKIFKFFRASNTGLSMFEIKDDGRWRLNTWNDYAHLGEIKENDLKEFT